jgi:hypothetical protein
MGKSQREIPNTLNQNYIVERPVMIDSSEHLCYCWLPVSWSFQQKRRDSMLMLDAAEPSLKADCAMW